MNATNAANDTHRKRMLIAAFLAWMFAGLENSLFILIHRQMMLELLGPETAERVIAEWFAWFQSALLFGAAAGGWFFGSLGDRFGRTQAMGLSVACYSGFTLMCYFVRDPHLMWVLRFLACLGFGGSWPNAVALVAEAWPSASRPLMAGIMGTAANFGFVLLGCIGYTFVITNEHWRWVFLIGGSPVLLAAWILVAVPESAKWLSLRHAASEQPTSKAAVVEVFQRPLLYRTLLGICLGAIPVVGTAANANWIVPWTDQYEARSASAMDATSQNRLAGPSSPDNVTSASLRKPRAADPRKKALAQIQRSTGAIFGSLLGGIMASCVGRRLSYFLISLCTFVVSSVLFTQLNPHHAMFPYMTFLLGFFGVTYFGWLPLFLPELFPTRVRTTGTGISFNTGRIIAAFVVLLAAFRMDSFQGDYARVGFWSGMIYVAGMIVIWFAPKKNVASAEDAR